MRLLINYNFFWITSSGAAMWRYCRRSIQRWIQYAAIKSASIFFLCNLLASSAFAQQNIREDILLNNGWTRTSPSAQPIPFPFNTNEYYWSKVNLPDNCDAYNGYRRLLHGNLHGSVWYRKELQIVQPNKKRRNFLFFEGVGSYAKVYVNNIFVGEHVGEEHHLPLTSPEN